MQVDLERKQEKSPRLNWDAGRGHGKADLKCKRAASRLGDLARMRAGALQYAEAESHTCRLLTQPTCAFR